MIYFQNVADLEEAKLRYRALAKELHPDKGGYVLQFQQMQEEYKTLLLQLESEQATTVTESQTSDIVVELRKLAKVLIQKQVPQKYLQQKIEQSQSPLERGLISKLVEFLNQIEIK